MGRNTKELSEKELQGWLITPYIIAIIGVVFCTGYFISSNVGRYTRCTESAMATVISYKEDWYWDDSSVSSEEKVRYLVTVSYSVRGKTYISQSRTGTTSPADPVGSVIKVLYNPNDPSEFCLIDDAGPLTAYVMLGIVGIVVVVGVSVWSIFKIRKLSHTSLSGQYM